MIKGNSIYPAYNPGLTSPLLTGPVAFFGNQNTGQLFTQVSTQVDPNFVWGPSMEQVYSDIGDNFANAVNGHGTLAAGLNAGQHSTIASIKNPDFSAPT